MHKAGWRVSLFCFLLPAVVLADDARVSATDSYASSTAVGSALAYQLDTGHTSGWQFPPTTGIPVYSTRANEAIADLNFRDPGALARVSKVREISLLTLAEIGKSRFFFGINNEGLFGFHLGARPRLGNDRCVELARMPYLNSAARVNVNY